MDIKQLEVLLKFVLDKSGLDSAKRGVGDVTERVKQLKRQAAETREAMEKIGQVAGQMTIAGTAILTPIALAARAYVDAVGTLEPTSARAMVAMNRMSQVQLRIGKSATEIMNPAMEQTADILEYLAGVIEKNPWLLKMVMEGGGALLGGGLALGAATNTVKNISTLTELLAPLLAKAGIGGGAAAGAGLAGLGLGGLATGAAVVGGGVALGLGTYQALAKSDFNKDGKAPPLEQFATVGANVLGNIFEKVSVALGKMNPEEADRKTTIFTAIIGKLTGAIDENSPLWQKAQASLPENGKRSEPIITQPMMDAFTAWQEAQQQRIDFEKETEANRTKVVETAGKKRAEIESNLQDSTIKLRLAASKAESQAYEDYLISRRQKLENANKEEQRAEEDHQREMLQALSDHNNTIYDLALRRDAVGIDLENKRFQEQTNAAESEQDLRMRRLNEDLADELRTMDQAYRLQRSRRQEQLQEQINQQQEAAAKQLAVVEEQKQEELKAIEEASSKQLDLLKKAEEQRLATLRYVALNDVSLLQKTGAEMTAKFKTWLETASRNLSLPVIGAGTGAGKGTGTAGKANGGYASGVVGTGENGYEWVMNHNLVRAAESALGGRVTNEGMSNLLGGGGGHTVNIYTESGRISSGKLQSDLKTMKDAVMQSLDDALYLLPG